ncbi:MAG: glycogen-binding domain-containing protein [Balneolaceae bacterium]
MFTHSAHSQNVEGFLSLDSSIGYTSNTFLNPYINEWDRSDLSGYASISPMGQLLWDAGNFSGDVTSGYVYQPLFDDRPSFNGFYGNTNVRYRLSSKWMTEIQVSGSNFTSTYNRSLVAVLPSLTWSPGFFTRIRARAGSSFRNYSNLEAEGQAELSDRVDLYGVEIETWPSFNWRVRAGFNGNVNENLIGNHTLSFGLERIIQQSWRLSLQAATDRYSTDVVTTTGGGGTPPIGGPPGGGEETTTTEESDRLIRTGVSLSRTFFNRFTATASLSHVQFFPAENESLSDIQTALNFRYTFPVSRLMGGGKKDIDPKWDDEGDGVVFVSINYQDDGDLFLVGEFNNWERPGIPLSKQTERRYAAQLELESGIYEYKILRVVNGEEDWIDLSDDAMTVSDGFGGQNGLIYID